VPVAHLSRVYSELCHKEQWETLGWTRSAAPPANRPWQILCQTRPPPISNLQDTPPRPSHVLTESVAPKISGDLTHHCRSLQISAEAAATVVSVVASLHVPRSVRL
jgi:hypothetical protein